MRWNTPTTIRPDFALRRCGGAVRRPRLGCDRPARGSSGQPVRVRPARLPDDELPPRPRGLGAGRQRRPARGSARGGAAARTPCCWRPGTSSTCWRCPTHLGRRVLQAAGDHAGVVGPGRLQVRGPVAATPTGRWMFLVRPGDPLRPELEQQPRRRAARPPARGCPLRPAGMPEGPVRWVVSPGRGRVAPAGLVRAAAAAGRRGVGAAAARAVSPAAVRHPKGGLSRRPARTPATGRRRGR